MCQEFIAGGSVAALPWSDGGALTTPNRPAAPTGLTVTESQTVRSQETTPNGDSTEVPNLPSQRAWIRFLLKSSALEDSDHCTPTPWP